MAMSKQDRRDEIDRLVKSALEDLEVLDEAVGEDDGLLGATHARMLARARDDLARAKALIEAGT